MCLFSLPTAAGKASIQNGQPDLGLTLLMYVAVSSITLHISASQSLKNKRGVLRSLIARVRQRFNVAIAETGDSDRWQVAVLGLACVSNSPSHATEMLDEAVRFIEEEILGLAEVVDCQTEVLPGLE